MEIKDEMEGEVGRSLETKRDEVEMGIKKKD